MKLDKLRIEINKLDRDLISVLAKRATLSRLVGVYKIEQGIKINQPTREKEILQNILQVSGKKKIDDKFVTVIFKLIFANSKKIQQQMIVNPKNL